MKNYLLIFIFLLIFKGFIIGGEKLKLVLLPAYGTTESLYSYMLPELKAKYDVTVIELVNYDDITKASDSVFNELKNKYASSFENDTFYMAGTSMGGMVLMEFMRKHSNKVAKLVIINSNFNPLTKQQEKGLKSRIEFFENLQDGVLPEKTDTDFLNIKHLTKKNKQLVVEMEKSIGVKGLINQAKLLLSRTSYVEDFKTYNTPTLIITSDSDIVVKDDVVQSMYNALPKNIANLVVIKNAGHFSPLDNPKDLLKAMDNFINKK